MTVITTPCVGVCVLDPQAGICLGCGRTGDEIARWTRMTQAERERVMAALGERLRGSGQPARADKR